MLFLFLGFELTQLFILFGALSHSELTLVQILITVLFSVVTDIIPILGYVIGKKIAGKSISNWIVLISLGLVVGLIQNSLFEFGILSSEQFDIATVISAVLFFIVAFLPINNKQIGVQV